jgi:hypothetical protein
MTGKIHDYYGAFVVPDIIKHGTDSLKTTSTRVFSIVRGVMPTLSSHNHDIRSLKGSSAATISSSQAGSIWTGPEEIIQDRFLAKHLHPPPALGGGVDSSTTVPVVVEHHHHNLKLLAMKTSKERKCIMSKSIKGFSMDVVNSDNEGKPYAGGSRLKWNETGESFVLHSGGGKSVAKCINRDDNVGTTFIICGTNPLFPSDEHFEKQACGLTFYPWFQVLLEHNDHQDDLAIELWSGLSYTPLWYAENIASGCKIDIISAEDDNNTVGSVLHIKDGGGDCWDVKSTMPGIDPAVFICLAAIIVRFTAESF